MEIRKVRKQGDQKIVNVPAKSDISIGDFVLIEKVDLKSGKEIQLQNLKENFPIAYAAHIKEYPEDAQ